MVVLTVTVETFHTTTCFQTARETWIELHTLYIASTENQLYVIWMQFLQMEPGVLRLKNLWNELNSGFQNTNKAILLE